MKFPACTIFLITIFTTVLFSRCTKLQKPDVSKIITGTGNVVEKTAPARLAVVTEEEVTFYPTYAYKEDNFWKIHLRGWVHESRKHLNKFVTKIADVKDKCSETEMNTFKSRSDDFEAADKSFETVIIKFDSDPENEPYTLRRSEFVGIVEMDLALSLERANQLLENKARRIGG